MLANKRTEHGNFWLLLVILSLAALGVPSPATGETAGGDSPQAVFDLAQAAGAKKDFSALAKLVAKTEQPLYALVTDMAVGMFVELYEGEKSAEIKEKYAEIQKRHGVKEETGGEKLKITNDTPQEVIDAHIRKRAQAMYGQVDVEKYVPEVMSIVAGMPEMSGQAFFPQEKLTDLKIEGDRATGTAGQKKISFIRENERWFLSADVMN